MSLRVVLGFRRIGIETRGVWVDRKGGKGIPSKGKKGQQRCNEECMSVRQGVRTAEVEADKGRWVADRSGGLKARPRNVNFSLSRH